MGEGVYRAACGAGYGVGARSKTKKHELNTVSKLLYATIYVVANMSLLLGLV